MRKSLLGILLAATLLPISSVYASTPEQDATVKSEYATKKVVPNKTIQQAMKEAIEDRPAGMSVLDAMAALLAADPANFNFAIAAAISVSPSQAGQITSFAIGKGVPADLATQAAIAAKPTAASDIVLAAISAAPDQAAAIKTIAIATAPANQTAAINNAYSQATTTGTTGTTGTTATTGSTGGGGSTCNPQKATCT